MEVIKIREPIWKTRSIGIAEYHFNNNEKIKVDIVYRNKKGYRIYPKSFIVSKWKILNYPFQYVGGVKLRIIPIEELQVNE